MNALIGIAIAIVGLSILVIIHECGHYFAARAFGMRVLRYSIGFGKTIFKYKPEGSPTTFQVAMVPFLAYVEIDGMNPFAELDEDDPAIFPNQSAFARTITLAAGPFANYMAAVALAFVIGLIGWPAGMVSMADPAHPVAQRGIPGPMTVGGIVDGSPAAKSPMKPGDIIVEANHEAIKNIEDLIRVTKIRGAMPTEYIIERDGKKIAPIIITPDNVDGVGRIGVSAHIEPVYVKMGVAEAAKASVVYPWRITLFQITSIGNMVKKRTSEGLGGPVAMVQGLSQAAKAGLVHFLTAIMLLSVALGFFNLLPFPALDGGRLLFVFYEFVTRRKPNEKVEAVIHGVALVFLLTLMVFVTFRDISRLVEPSDDKIESGQVEKPADSGQKSNSKKTPAFDQNTKE